MYLNPKCCDISYVSFLKRNLNLRTLIGERL